MEILPDDFDFMVKEGHALTVLCALQPRVGAAILAVTPVPMAPAFWANFCNKVLKCLLTKRECSLAATEAKPTLWKWRYASLNFDA